MNDFLSWFDQIQFWSVVSVAPALLAIEYLISRIEITQSTRQLILINLWQIVGLVFPVFWLLRCANSYSQLAVIAIIVAFFGVYKPTRVAKETSSDF